jgi:hypothetical protein
MSQLDLVILRKKLWSMMYFGQLYLEIRLFEIFTAVANCALILSRATNFDRPYNM